LNGPKITRHEYGGKVETDCENFVSGLIELFDDLADFALSRILSKILRSNPNINIKTLPKKDIDHFKLTWYVTLAELMFFSMRDQPKFEEIKSLFYAEMDQTAVKRNAIPYLMETRIAIPKLIQRDKDFVTLGIFSSPMNNREEDTPRNRGLGPKLANIIIETSFATNPMIGEIYDEISEIFELELNNAYGHCSVSCATFVIV